MDKPRPTDELLLRRFASGECDALGELAARHEQHLLGLARGLLGGDRQAACDAVQESWVLVIRHASSFNGGSSFKTWMYRIVVNRCHTVRAKRHPVDAHPMHEHEGSEHEPIHRTNNIIEDIELQEAMSRLPDAKRDVLLLCYHASLTHEQAADVMEIPVGTLKSRLHAALRELRKALAPAEVER